MNGRAQPLASNNHLLGVLAVPKIAVTGAGGAPLPSAPPCILHLRRPAIGADLHG